MSNLQLRVLICNELFVYRPLVIDYLKKLTSHICLIIKLNKSLNQLKYLTNIEENDILQNCNLLQCQFSNITNYVVKPVVYLTLSLSKACLCSVAVI